MKELKLSVILFMILYLFTFCDDLFDGTITEIDLPKHQHQLVSHAFFYEGDSILTVIVENSVGILDTIEPQIIDNANVQLLKNDILEYTFSFVDSVDAYQVELEQPFTPDQNDIYELRVSAPEFDAVSASQIISKKVEILEVKRNSAIDTTASGYPIDEFIIKFKDFEQERNLYQFSGISNLTVRSSHNGDLLWFEKADFSFKSNNPNYNNGILLDNNFDGLIYSLILTAKPPISISGSGIDIIYEDYLFINSASLDFVNYYNSLIAYQDAEGNPFAEPVVLFSNMSNGTGMFCIFSTNKFLIE